MWDVLLLITTAVALQPAPPSASREPPPALVKEIASAPSFEQAARLRSALQQYPDQPYLLLLLGHALIWDGEYEEARTTLTRAISLAPASLTYVRGGARLALAIVDGTFPEGRQRAQREIEALLDEHVLSHMDTDRAHLTLVRLLGQAGELDKAEAHMRVVSRRMDAMEEWFQDMAVAERALLHLRQGHQEQARALLPRLVTSRNRLAWWLGILVRLYLDDTEGLDALVSQVPLNELPGAHRLPAQALRQGLAGEPWEALVARQLERFPFDTATAMVAAWLARGEGRPDFRRGLVEALAGYPNSVWLAPPWAREERP